MASQGMILRNMNLVGGHSGRVAMPEDMKKTFEEGCYLIFMRWTALQLAIHNEWGGSDSKAKAKALYDDVVDWFYTTKDHEMSDLQELLDEVIQVDFHVQAEDDSPYMVSRSLVNMYHQVAHGDVSYVQTLREQFEKNGENVVAKSMRDPGSFMGEDPNDDGSSSSSDGEEEGEDDGMDVDDAPSNQPTIDEDGFQMVQRGGRH